MKDTRNALLLTELTNDESAALSGGCHYHRRLASRRSRRSTARRPIIRQVTRVRLVINS